MRVVDRYELARDLRKRYAAASRAERDSCPCVANGLPNFTIVGLTGAPEAEDVPSFLASGNLLTHWRSRGCSSPRSRRRRPQAAL
jgi:hypothetical protein